MSKSSEAMNALIRGQLGQEPPKEEPGSAGSADGAAGSNYKPRLSINRQMNEALRSAWLRRKGRVG